MLERTGLEDAPDAPEATDALVIGASGVLGSAIAHRLARGKGGRRVLGTYFENVEGARRLQREHNCAIERLDVRDEAAVDALIARVRPRALVLCAGVAGGGLAASLSARAWDESLRMHLDSVFWTLRAALKYLPPGGRVVWIGSRVARSGGRGQSAYAAAKAGGEALVRCAAREGAPRRIAVNTVCPGFISSPLTSGLSPQRHQHERERDAGGELGDSGPCAEMVAWLLGGEADGISGQVLHADARLF
jgi:NAD(P)-dependent dehydrogenase (short-subunit alcohol dehydrogenase family)